MNKAFIYMIPVDRSKKPVYGKLVREYKEIAALRGAIPEGYMMQTVYLKSK